MGYRKLKADNSTQHSTSIVYGFVVEGITAALVFFRPSEVIIADIDVFTQNRSASIRHENMSAAWISRDSVLAHGKLHEVLILCSIAWVISAEDKDCPVWLVAYLPV